MISVTSGIYCSYNSNIKEKTPLELEQELSRANKEIERLNNIINKAIEYIGKHKPSDIGICGNEIKYYYTLGEDSVDDLLNILQDKEEV